MEPMFYGATREDTVFSELNVAEGDFVHLCGIRIKQNAVVRMAALGELLHVVKMGYLRVFGFEPDQIVSKSINSLSFEQAQRLLYVDAFLAETLADSKGEQNAYTNSRAVKQEIFQKLPKLEGFFYPSVRDTLGLNLVVLPPAIDRKFDVTCSCVVQIRRKHRFNFFDWDVCRVITGINDDGAFSSIPPSFPKQQIIFSMTAEEELLFRKRGREMSAVEIADFLKVTSQRSIAAYT